MNEMCRHGLPRERHEVEFRSILVLRYFFQYQMAHIYQFIPS
jgi:hypothetical protein